MKKHISLIGGLLISTILIGCSETKILDENTKDNISEKYTITERNIENTDKDKVFIPSFFDGDILYGTKMKDGSGNIKDYTMIYYLDSTGAIKNMEEGMLTNEEVDFIKGNGGFKKEGIYATDTNNLNEKTYYYLNLVDKTKFKLNDYEKIYSSIESKFKNFSEVGYNVSGNNNYYINQYLSNEGDKLGEENELVIIDKENQRYYASYNNKLYIYFYYDNNENSIMAIDSHGLIYKIIIQENKLTYEFYKDMGLNDLKIYDNYSIRVIDGNENRLIFKIENKDSKENIDNYNFLYNNKTNEILQLDNEKIIDHKLENINFYGVFYMKNWYLAEIREDGNINLVYKLDDYGYRYMGALANDNGEKIFLARVHHSYESIKNSDKRSINEDVRYSILEIQER